MALTRTNIIGRITLPDDTNPVNSVVRFVMTGFDTEAGADATVIPIPVDATIDALGNIDVNLWPNPIGVRTTFYSVIAKIPDGNTIYTIDIYLGKISVPSTGGPYDLNDLLPIAPPAGADVADYIAQLAAAVASAEAAAVSTAADAVATAADAEATAADAIATAADAVDTAAALAAVQAIASVGYTGTPGGPADIASTANLTLSGEQTIDGVLTSASRILVKDQTAPAENGIYVTGAGAWVRATDMDQAGEFLRKSVYVSNGDTNGGRTYGCASTVATVGTDPVSFTLLVDQGILQQALTQQASDISDVIQVQNLSGISDWTPDTVYSLGTLANTGTVAESLTYWSANSVGVANGALLESFEVNTIGDLTGRIAVVDANNIVTDFYDFSVVGTGNKVVTPARPIRVGAGALVFVKANNNNLTAATTGAIPSRYFLATEFDGTVGDYVLTAAITAGAAFKINLIESDVTIPGRLADLDTVSEPDTALTDSGTTFEDATLIFPAGSPSIQGIARAADAGVDFPVGAVVRSAHADLRLYSTADFVRVTLLKRLTSAGSSAWVSSVDGPAFQTHQFPVADIDPDIDTAGTSRLTFPVDPFVVEDGYSYFVVIQQFTADFVGVNMAVGRGSNSLNNRQHSRGWFAANVNALPTSVLTSPSYVCLGFDWKAVPQAIEKAGYARITDASLSISGTTATVKARTDDGTVGARYVGTTGTATIALCAAGNSRYDVLWMNVRTMTFGVATGDERTTDTAEFVPDVGDPNRIALFNILVNDVGYDYVPVWHLVAGDAPAYRNDLMAQIDRSRSAIPKTLAKLRRGDPVHIVQTGDSIAAAQSGTASEILPNTVNRDRYESYLTTYGADYKAAISLYSATDFGRTDDGAGAIYAAITSVAQTVIAMRAAGYAVQYDNFAIGSKNTSHIVGAAAPYAVTTWYQNTLDLAGDLMIFHFGMNDDATSDLAAAMVAAINFAKTAGYECLVIGRARRDEAFYNQQTFHKSNKYLRDAAEYAGAAFIDVAALYTDDAAGVLGLSPLSYCQANNNNHPGVREMAATSRALLKVLT